MGAGLVVIAVLVPTLALLLEHAGSVRFAERHHRHHDTYVVPTGFTRAVVLAMTFLSVAGLVLSWVCLTDVSDTDPVIVLAFSDAFVVTGFALWWVLCRYKVSVFEDRMVITPFLGSDAEVLYSQIDRMEWVGIRRDSGMRSLDVDGGGARAVRLGSMVDVAQILMSIDRFDVLPRAA